MASLKIFLSMEEFYSIIDTMIENVEEHFEGGSYVSSPNKNLPFLFEKEAIKAWGNFIKEMAPQILEIANGIALVKGDYKVQAEHVLDAIKIYKKGIRDPNNNFGF